MLFQTLQLEAVQADCWRLLEQAVTDRDCGWRLPVLATRTAAAVRQRTVVLRAVRAAERQVFLHTDIRSAKVQQIQEHPDVSLLFYDHARGVQLQLSGRATLHTHDAAADTLWQHSPPEALRMYLGLRAPGTPLTEPCTNLPPHVRGRIPERGEIEPGRPQFAAVAVTVQQAEWLLLSRDGNLRARFCYDVAAVEDSLRAEWLAP